MRVIVISDTHRDFRAFEEVVLRHKENADLFLHLGDGERELELIRELYPTLKFLNVCGNCDFCATAPDAGCTTCGKAKIFYTHGHLYHVKSGLDEVLTAGRAAGANVVAFGHTHDPLNTYVDGVHLINPGSLGQPKRSARSYAMIDITSAGIVCILNYI